MSEDVVTPPAPDEEPDTEQEFQALYADAEAGKQRLIALAAEFEKNGKPELASVLREMNGTVLSLLQDVIASSGAAFVSVEDDVGDLIERDPDDPVTESVLLKKDGEEFLLYLEQIGKLIKGLQEAVPSDNREQQEIFAKLQRLTDDRIAFVKEITVDEEEEVDPDDEAETH